MPNQYTMGVWCWSGNPVHWQGNDNLKIMRPVLLQAPLFSALLLPYLTPLLPDGYGF